MFTFPSEEAARGWFDDADYQALSEFRRAGAPLTLLPWSKVCRRASKRMHI